MNPCFCFRFYRASTPNTIKEYAFSGSLCRIREFETLDGKRYCITIFSLSDYRHLHFPHEEYESLTCQLRTLLSEQAVTPTQYNETVKLGDYGLTIGPVSAFGTLKTSPFIDVDENDSAITCDSKWDICTCTMCPIFNQLTAYEARAKEIFGHRKHKNIIF